MADLQVKVVETATGRAIDIYDGKFGVTIAADAAPDQVDIAATMLMEHAAGFSKVDVMLAFVEATGMLARG